MFFKINSGDVLIYLRKHYVLHVVKINKIRALVFFCFLIIFTFDNANAYQPSAYKMDGSIFGDLTWEPEPLTSDSEVIGNYEVILITDPYTPNVNQTTHMQLKVFNYNQGPYGDKSNYASIGVNHFLMGIRIYYDDQLVDTVPPELHKGDSWSFDHVFNKSGNHVLKVDLYNIGKDNGLETYVFNVPVLTRYGSIFSDLIIAASVAVASVLIWMKVSTSKKNKLSKT